MQFKLFSVPISDDGMALEELKEATGLSENELDNSMFSIIKQKDKFHAQVNEGLRELKTQSEKIRIGLLSSIYFTYKGKWYVWQIF